MGEEMNRASQRALIDRAALARESTRADLSPYFRPNGTRLPAVPPMPHMRQAVLQTGGSR